jgi:hypothetical protein
MERFLTIPADKLSREDVVHFLPIHGSLDYASPELQAEAAAFDDELGKVNARHRACCQSIDDALANLTQAPDAAQLRNAVGERADNTLNDVQSLARLWVQKVDLLQRYSDEIEAKSEAAASEAKAKAEDVLRSLKGLGFDVDRDPTQGGIDFAQFVKTRHPEAKRLQLRANQVDGVRRAIPQRLKSETDGARHAESYARAVAGRYVAGKL